jgi:hypothetical protein
MGGHIVLGNLAGRPDAVHISGVENPEDWDIGGPGGSDSQVIPEGGEVMGGIGMQQGSFVVLRDSIQALTLTNSGAYTFTRSVTDDVRGTIAPRSIVAIGNGQFVFLSDNGFYMNSNSTPIGAERVNRWFLEAADSQYLAETIGVKDPYEQIVWWTYRRNNGLRELIGFHYGLNRWTRANVSTSYMAAQESPGVAFDALEGTFDDQNRPFDDRSLMGGVPVFAAFNASAEMGYFTGLPMLFQAETADIEMTPGNRTFVREATVIADTDNVRLAIGAKDRHGDVRDWSNYSTPNRAGRCPFRSDAKLHRFRVQILAGITWRHCHGVRPETVRTGRQ